MVYDKSEPSRPDLEEYAKRVRKIKDLGVEDALLEAALSIPTADLYAVLDPKQPGNPRIGIVFDRVKAPINYFSYLIAELVRHTNEEAAYEVRVTAPLYQEPLKIGLHLSWKTLMFSEKTGGRPELVTFDNSIDYPRPIPTSQVGRFINDYVTNARLQLTEQPNRTHLRIAQAAQAFSAAQPTHHSTS